MNKLKIIIIDDELHAREIIKNYLQNPMFRGLYKKKFLKYLLTNNYDF